MYKINLFKTIDNLCETLFITISNYWFLFINKISYITDNKQLNTCLWYTNTNSNVQFAFKLLLSNSYIFYISECCNTILSFYILHATN